MEFGNTRRGREAQPQAGPREIAGVVFLRWEGYRIEVRMISTHLVHE